MCRTIHAILSSVICGIQMLVRVFMTTILMVENIVRMFMQTLYNFLSFMMQLFSLVPICCVFLVTSRMKCFMCGGGGPCPVNRGGACDCLMSVFAAIILFLIFRATGVLDKIFYNIGYTKATTKVVRFIPTTGTITECSRNDTDTEYVFYPLETTPHSILREMYFYIEDDTTLTYTTETDFESTNPETTITTPIGDVKGDGDGDGNVIDDDGTTPDGDKDGNLIDDDGRRRRLDDDQYTNEGIGTGTSENDTVGNKTGKIARRQIDADNSDVYYDDTSKGINVTNTSPILPPRKCEEDEYDMYPDLNDTEIDGKVKKINPHVLNKTEKNDTNHWTTVFYYLV